MKKILLGCALVLPSILFSQSTIGFADYKIKLAEDHFYFDGTILFNQEESLFSYKNRNENRWFRNDEETGPFQIIYTDSIGYYVWRRSTSKEAIVRSFCGKSALIFKDTLNIDWDLIDEKRTISGIECRKAVTTFRGRDYEVWYAPSIPVSAGPWKFVGLPGLIFNVSDSKKEVHIYLEKIKYSSTLTSIQKPQLPINTDKDSFFECLDVEWAKYYKRNAAIIAKLQAKSPDIEISDNNLPKNRPATELEFE